MSVFFLFCSVAGSLVYSYYTFVDKQPSDATRKGSVTDKKTNSKGIDNYV